MPQVRGYFTDGLRRPFVNAELILPRFRVWAAIRLLVDTGADSTAIHWRDRQRLRTAEGRPLAPGTSFAQAAQASGIAGTPVQYGREDALLAFGTAEGSRILARLPVDIELAPSAIEVPSLLGRDVLSEARLDFNMPADDLVLDWVVA